MEDELTITPPNSPVFSGSHRNELHDDLNSDSLSERIEDWSVRIFNCSGECSDKNLKRNSDLSVHDMIATDDMNLNLAQSNDPYIRLFNYQYDKGSALLLHCDSLFKMAKLSYMKLNSSANSNVNNLGMHVSSKKSSDHLKCRQDFAMFALYVRNYVQRVNSSQKYNWLVDDLFMKVMNELTSFRLLFGSTSDLPEYIINYSASSLGNNCSQPSYHLFHCHLDVRWHHLTLLYNVISCNQKLKSALGNSQIGNMDTMSWSTFEDNISFLISDLIILALKRFQLFQLQDLHLKSMFSCTCVRELWTLLRICTDYLYEKSLCKKFWQFVSIICTKISSVKKSNEYNDCSKLSLPTSYFCSNPTSFVLWCTMHLLKLYKDDAQFQKHCDYDLLENSLKAQLSTDVPELLLRSHLLLIEDILSISWEMRAQPLIMLWEYFHKRLNCSFFVPGAPICSLAVVSKSGIELLTRLNSKLDSNKPDPDSNSFHLFLRLLGRNLRRWQENPRFWNQIKGRIFSKFSASKLSTLNETGLYNFIALMLTLAITSDLHEVISKLQSLLKFIPMAELDGSRTCLIWKTHIAIVLLFAERNQDVKHVSNPLLEFVQNAALQPECLNLMRTFCEGFQDLIDCTNNLELGQYSYIGSWISNYLSICNESDASRLLETLLSLANKLNSIMSVHLPLSSDNQLIMLYDALWEHVVPYLKKTCLNPSTSFQIPDFAATMTLLSSKSCFSLTVRNRSHELFNSLITSDVIDGRVLCRYLSQLSHHGTVHHLFNNQSILLIKSWLRCLILNSNDENSDNDFAVLTNVIKSIPEMNAFLSEEYEEFNVKTVFQHFLNAVSRKYEQLQESHTKNKLFEQISAYFSNIDRWLMHVVKLPKSADIIFNVYRNVGSMFLKIPYLLYQKILLVALNELPLLLPILQYQYLGIKDTILLKLSFQSRPNNTLNCLLDLLLLPMNVRNPQYKLHPYVSSAIKRTLDNYVRGLLQLDPVNDIYISRSIRELITLYVPRLVAPKGSLGYSQFSLLTCFDVRNEHDKCTSKQMIEVLCNYFLRKKSKSPHQFAYQTLLFLNEILHNYKHNDRLVECFVESGLEKVCDVLMFCDESNQCKREARLIVKFVLDLNAVRNNDVIGDKVLNVFSKLCFENLAFSSKVLFDLFEEMLGVAPDLVARFLPQFKDRIREVENKRGVGFDRALRKGLENIEQKLHSIRML